MQKILGKSIPNEVASAILARQFATEFLEPIKNFTVFLDGGLGAGKTFWVREILQYFGVRESVISPTYTYMQLYSIENKKIVHFDCYRLKNSSEFKTKGFEEIAHDSSVSKFVEWGENLGVDYCREFSGTHFVVKLKHGIGVGMRRIDIFKSTPA